jgi:hypothetical protein
MGITTCFGRGTSSTAFPSVACFRVGSNKPRLNVFTAITGFSFNVYTADGFFYNQSDTRLDNIDNKILMPKIGSMVNGMTFVSDNLPSKFTR